MSTKESRDYLEMTYRSIECFSNDGLLLPAELQKILDIALRDGVVDDNEQRVLLNIIRKLTPAELSVEMLEKLAEVRKLLGSRGVGA
jgi:hypothetical protein